MLEDIAKAKAIGTIKIIDYDTKEIVLETKNGVNAEAISLALAESLSHQTNGCLNTIVFGNGAASVSGVGSITYLTPNITGTTATLYNQTYSKIIDNQNPSNLDPTRNRIDVSHVAGNLFTDIIVTCILDIGEPANQSALDNATSLTSPYVFNEIGLVSYSGMLLTHAIFSPVEKSMNRTFQIFYTLRIQSV